MTTLVEVSNGKNKRRCDAKCYNAKGDKCTCICGGANHGKGLDQAMANTNEHAEEWVDEYQRENPGEPSLDVYIAPSQMPMFLEFYDLPF